MKIAVLYNSLLTIINSIGYGEYSFSSYDPDEAAGIGKFYGLFFLIIAVLAMVFQNRLDFGSKTPSICSNCGAKLSSGGCFCAECGTNNGATPTKGMTDKTCFRICVGYAVFLGLVQLIPFWASMDQYGGVNFDAPMFISNLMGDSVAINLFAGGLQIAFIVQLVSSILLCISTKKGKTNARSRLMRLSTFAILTALGMVVLVLSCNHYEEIPELKVGLMPFIQIAASAAMRIVMPKHYVK